MNIIFDSISLHEHRCSRYAQSGWFVCLAQFDDVQLLPELWLLIRQYVLDCYPFFYMDYEYWIEHKGMFWFSSDSLRFGLLGRRLECWNLSTIGVWRKGRNRWDSFYDRSKFDFQSLFGFDASLRDFVRLWDYHVISQNSSPFVSVHTAESFSLNDQVLLPSCSEMHIIIQHAEKIVILPFRFITPFTDFLVRMLDVLPRLSHENIFRQQENTIHILMKRMINLKPWY
jgi:hypothetical protein